VFTRPFGKFCYCGDYLEGRKLLHNGGWIYRLTRSLKVMEQRRISQVIFETNSKCMMDAIQQSNVCSHNLAWLLVILKMFCYVVQTSWLSLLSGKRTWLLTHTLVMATISWARRYIFETSPLCITSLSPRLIYCWHKIIP
jgi:hypothetical protein